MKRSTCACLLSLFTAAPLLAVTLSGVQAVATSTTAATVQWTTDVPSTSQVILTLGNQNAPYVLTPRDGTLTVKHSVSLANLVPSTTYYYYAASTDAGGTLGDSWSQSTQFTTPAIVATAALDYRIDESGPQNVYAGSNLYFALTSVQLSGAPQHLAFNVQTSFPYSVDCGRPGFTCLTDGKTSVLSEKYV